MKSEKSSNFSVHNQKFIIFCYIVCAVVFSIWYFTATGDFLSGRIERLTSFVMYKPFQYRILVPAVVHILAYIIKIGELLCIIALIPAYMELLYSERHIQPVRYAGDFAIHCRTDIYTQKKLDVFLYYLCRGNIQPGNKLLSLLYIFVHHD